ncbi:hypothetical protein EYF80_031994 [Liparis tanakae]|uniref:Uncharacterized protein n=1 Tax=Liparis tanakae TaxID=230148 RepID=A0A4Z2GX34_9TELE|nr:hypothetical protein EYF80_031994 [Liparis tanakae]
MRYQLWVFRRACRPQTTRCGTPVGHLWDTCGTPVGAVHTCGSCALVYRRLDSSQSSGSPVTCFKPVTDVTSLHRDPALEKTICLSASNGITTNVYVDVEARPSQLSPDRRRLIFFSSHVNDATDSLEEATSAKRLLEGIHSHNGEVIFAVEFSSSARGERAPSSPQQLLPLRVQILEVRLLGYKYFVSI